jgi:hypothetical protein
MPQKKYKVTSPDGKRSFVLSWDGEGEPTQGDIDEQIGRILSHEQSQAKPKTTDELKVPLAGEQPPRDNVTLRGITAAPRREVIDPSQMYSDIPESERPPSQHPIRDAVWNFPGQVAEKLIGLPKAIWESAPMNVTAASGQALARAKATGDTEKALSEQFAPIDVEMERIRNSPALQAKAMLSIGSEIDPTGSLQGLVSGGFNAFDEFRNKNYGGAATDIGLAALPFFGGAAAINRLGAAESAALRAKVALNPPPIVAPSRLLPPAPKDIPLPTNQPLPLGEVPAARPTATIPSFQPRGGVSVNAGTVAEQRARAFAAIDSEAQRNILELKIKQSEANRAGDISAATAFDQQILEEKMRASAEKRGWEAPVDKKFEQLPSDQPDLPFDFDYYGGGTPRPSPFDLRSRTRRPGEFIVDPQGNVLPPERGVPPGTEIPAPERPVTRPVPEVPTAPVNATKFPVRDLAGEQVGETRFPVRDLAGRLVGRAAKPGVETNLRGFENYPRGEYPVGKTVIGDEFPVERRPVEEYRPAEQPSASESRRAKIERQPESPARTSALERLGKKEATTAAEKAAKAAEEASLWADANEFATPVERARAKESFPHLSPNDAVARMVELDEVKKAQILERKRKKVEAEERAQTKKDTSTAGGRFRAAKATEEGGTSAGMFNLQDFYEKLRETEAGKKLAEKLGKARFHIVDAETGRPIAGRATLAEARTYADGINDNLGTGTKRYQVMDNETGTPHVSPEIAPFVTPAQRAERYKQKLAERNVRAKEKKLALAEEHPIEPRNMIREDVPAPPKRRGFLPSPESFNDSMASHWAEKVAELDRLDSPDASYKKILSFGNKNVLKAGETWRGRVLRTIEEREASHGKGGTTVGMFNLQDFYEKLLEVRGEKARPLIESLKAARYHIADVTTGRPMRGFDTLEEARATAKEWNKIKKADPTEPIYRVKENPEFGKTPEPVKAKEPKAKSEPKAPRAKKPKQVSDIEPELAPLDMKSTYGQFMNRLRENTRAEVSRAFDLTRYRAEQARRSRMIETSGEAGHIERRRAQQLITPPEKMKFKPLDMPQYVIDDLVDSAYKHFFEDEFKAGRAADAIRQLNRGEYVTPEMRTLVSKIFPEQYRKEITTLYSNLPWDHLGQLAEPTKKVVDKVLSEMVKWTWGSTKTLKSTFDASFVGIQARGALTTKAYRKAWRKSWDAIWDQDKFDAQQEARFNDPYYDFIKEDMGVHFGDLEKQGLEGYSGNKTLEGFAPVKGLHRGAISFLNHVRFENAKVLAKLAEKKGIDMNNAAEMRSLGRIINESTGHGSLGEAKLNKLTGKMEASALTKGEELLGNVLWSPRLTASRINYLKLIDLREYKTPASRLAQAKRWQSAATILGSSLALMKMLEMAGGKGNYDPFSNRFGKVQVGDQVVDTTAGFGSLATLLARIVTGNVSDASGKKHNFWKGEWGREAGTELITGYFENKANPQLAYVSKLINQTNPYTGKPYNIPAETLELVMPLFVESALEGLRNVFMGDADLSELLLLIPGFGGLNVYEANRGKENSITESILSPVYAPKRKQTSREDINDFFAGR